MERLLGIQINLAVVGEESLKPDKSCCSGASSFTVKKEMADISCCERGEERQEPGD